MLDIVAKNIILLTDPVFFMSYYEYFRLVLD